MTKRRYNLYCPTAYALNIVGERWTLLIVRDLEFGPRRFTDLQADLPGIGPSLLSRRLKELENDNFVRRSKLPRPAATTVYELTEMGRTLLEDVITPLNNWGFQYLPPSPADDDICTPIPIMHGIKILFRPKAAREVMLTCEFHAGDEIFFVHVRGQTMEIKLGLAENPDVVADIDLRVFSELLTGYTQLSKAIANGAIEITAGAPEQLASFLSLLQMESPVE